MLGTILILTLVTSFVLSQQSSPVCVVNNFTNRTGKLIIRHRREKTCLQGFQPGQTNQAVQPQ